MKLRWVLCCWVTLWWAQVTTTEKTQKKNFIRALPMREVAPEDVSTKALVEGAAEALVLRGALRRDSPQLLRPWTLPTFAASVEAALVFVTAQAWPQGRGGSPNPVEGEDGSSASRAKCNGSSSMSLRRYGEEEDLWGGARRSPFDTTLGSGIVVPAFLEQVDFETVDWVVSGLHLSRPNWEGPFPLITTTTTPSLPATGAKVSCLVQGSRQLRAAPLSLTWALVQCGDDYCFTEDDTETTMKDDNNEEDGKDDIYKITSDQYSSLRVQTSDVLSGDCVYLPDGWTGWTRTLSSSVSFDLVWKDDLELLLDEDDPLWENVDLWDEDDTLCEDQELCDEGYLAPEEEEAFLWDEDPEDVDGHESGSRSGEGLGQSSSRASSSGRSPSLADYMPESLRHQRRILWSDQDPIPHLVGRYFLTTGSKDLEEFTNELRNDGTLLPYLVECPAECHSSIRELFRALDLDRDLRLTERDLTCLTLKDLDTLTYAADEVLNDLRDLSQDQWSSLKESPTEEVSSFLQKAKERREAQSRATARGLMEGSLTIEQEDQLKKNLPELYEQILEARKQREGLKEEL